ncbi:MAG: M20/M25/M40 family metallo-hydrolase, partial [Cloacibacillus sp.]
YDSVKELKCKYPECEFDVKIENLRLPCAIDENSSYIKNIEDIYKKLKYKCKKSGIFYLCDVSIVAQSLGVPFVIIGPGEDIYHSNTDEKVKLEDIIKMSKLYTACIL